MGPDTRTLHRETALSTLGKGDQTQTLIATKASENGREARLRTISPLAALS